MMTERKRRSEYGDELSSQSHSLTKKRHTSKEIDFHALSAEFDENAAMLDLDSIREFQKEAIWRQMQEYKRDAYRAQQRVNDLEHRQEAWAQRICSLCHVWDKTIEDVSVIATSLGPSFESSSEANYRNTSWLDVLLPNKLPSQNDNPKSKSNSIEGSIEDTAVVQQRLEQFNTAIRSIVQSLQNKDHASAAVDWKSVVDKLSQSKVSDDEVSELRMRVELFSRQVEEERELLERREGELRRALKRLDREICPTVHSIDTSNQHSSPDSTTVNNQSSPKHDTQCLQTNETKSTGSAGPSVTNGITQADQDQPDTQKYDYKALAESRLAEIKERMAENTELLKQIDSLKLQISAIPDHIVMETALHKRVEANRDYFQAEAQRLQAENERLFAEVAEIRSSRSEFEESIQTEANTQRQALEAEMQRLQNDLVRVRHHRDQIQRELEERRAQDAVENQKNTELKLISDARRERMNALISENKRLFAYVAILKGDRKGFETFTDSELSKATAVTDELRAKLEQATRQISKLSDKSMSSEPSTDDQKQAIMAELQQAKDEIKSMQVRLHKYEEILGGPCVNEDGEVSDDIPNKADVLASKQKELDELRLYRDGLQKTSEMMERELQTICDSFAKLEEQNTSKVWNMSAKEQHISRVVAEKCKYEEKFIALNKDREAQKQVNQALRHQNLKQLEHIKNIEERDRTLAQQLSLTEKESQQATTAWQAGQAKLQEKARQIQELEGQIKALEDRIRATTDLLGERTENLSKMEHEKKRVEEDLDQANRQISETEKTTDQSGLAQMCADYKALLKCPTCQTRFKSHVLLRCMHVFCKECIDSRIETRQRKCPSCSEPFGAKDVRQIYL